MTFYHKTPLGYIPFWYQKLSPGKITSMLGYFWGGSIKIPHKVITSFVRSFLTKEDGLINVYKKNYFDYVTKLNKKHIRDADRKHRAYKKQSQHCVSQFDCNYTYGFDEFFINFYVLHWALGNVDDVYVYKTPVAGNIYGTVGKIFAKVPLDLKDRFISMFLAHIKYGENLTFDQFLELFKNHDWSGKNKKVQVLYSKFYKYIFRNYKSLSRMMDRRELMKLKLMPEYLHDGNNLKKLSKKELQRRYNQLDGVIRSHRK